MTTQADAVKLAKDFHQKIIPLYGKRLVKVLLFGSFARNAGDDDSDIDLAIVLNEPLSRSQDRQKILDLLSDFCLKANCLLIPFFMSNTEYQTAPYAIHRSIIKEGIPV